MKNIALLYDHILDIGGVENHILSLLRGVDSNEFHFVIVSQVSPRFREKASAFGATVVVYHHWLGIDPRSSIDLSRLLKREHIDLIHAHSPIAALSGRLAAFYLGIPAIVTTHLPVTLYHGKKQTFRACFGRWIYTQLDRIENYILTDQMIYVSQRVHDQCIKSHLSPRARSVVIPVGIPIEEFEAKLDRSKLRQEFGAQFDTFVITFVGRLDEQKGIDILLRALEHTFSGDESIRLWIIGDGPLHSKLEERTKELHLDKVVQFWGWQSRIPEYLSASDLFILPSLFEATPISLLEALASGLAVITTSVGENKLIVDEGVNGVLVPPGDPFALGKAIEHLRNSPKERLKFSENGKITAKAFDEKNLTRRVEEIYRSKI